MTTPQGVSTFAYDPLGRRTAKHSAKGKTLFGWDGESSERRSVHYVHEAGSFVPLAQATRQELIALTASVAAKELMGANGRYDIDRDPLWNGEAESGARPGFAKEVPGRSPGHAAGTDRKTPSQTPHGRFVELHGSRAVLRAEMAYESFHMQHCLGQFADRERLEGGYGEHYAKPCEEGRLRLFSLRDANNQPHGP